MRVAIAMLLLLLGGCPLGPECPECPPCECPDYRVNRADAEPQQPTKVEPLVTFHEFHGMPHEIEQTPEYRKSCPLIPLKSFIETKQEGKAVLTIEVHNQSKKTIESFSFSSRCFDDSNEAILNERVKREANAAEMTLDQLIQAAIKIKSPRAHRMGDFLGNSDGEISRGRETKRGVWRMVDHPGCIQAITTIHEVHFSDDTTWEGEITQEFDPRPAPDSTNGGDEPERSDQ